MAPARSDKNQDSQLTDGLRPFFAPPLWRGLMATEGDKTSFAFAMRHVNVFWLYRYYVRPILDEASHVAVAHYPLMVAEARQRMLEAGLDHAAIEFVEGEIRHELEWPHEQPH